MEEWKLGGVTSGIHSVKYNDGVTFGIHSVKYDGGGQYHVRPARPKRCGEGWHGSGFTNRDGPGRVSVAAHRHRCVSSEAVVYANTSERFLSWTMEAKFWHLFASETETLYKFLDDACVGNAFLSIVYMLRDKLDMTPDVAPYLFRKFAELNLMPGDIMTWYIDQLFAYEEQLSNPFLKAYLSDYINKLSVTAIHVVTF